MLTTTSPKPGQQQVERTVEERIIGRTGRRLRWLQVENVGPCVVVRAVSPTYYVKQLALQAVLDIRVEAPDLAVEFDIDVR